MDKINEKINRVRPNGGQPSTPDGIRENGETVASRIEQFAEESKRRGDELYARSREIARLIRDASETAANEFEDYFVKSREAMEIVEQHLKSLMPSVEPAHRIEDKSEIPIPGFLTQGPRDE